MALITKSDLRNRVIQSSGFYTEINARRFAESQLLNEKKAADASSETFDIFLSHSSEDAIHIEGLRDLLTDAGFSVYVDWINDPQLNRANVTPATAALLRERMKRSRSLLYATSDSSKKSVWMPWELGYMDAYTNTRVAIVPIVDDDAASGGFRGQEYLGIYPYLDKLGSSFWIHASSSSYKSFSDWLEGSNPS